MRKNIEFVHPQDEAEEAELAALRDYGYARNVQGSPDWYYYPGTNNRNK